MQKSIAIGDVFNHLQGQYDIELLAAIRGFFDGASTIVDVKITDPRVLACSGDRLGAGVDARHGKPEAGHRLCHQAAAAADIEQVKTGKRAQRAQIAAKMVCEAGANKAEPYRIKLM